MNHEAVAKEYRDRASDLLARLRSGHVERLYLALDSQPKHDRSKPALALKLLLLGVTLGVASAVWFFLIVSMLGY